MIFEQNLINDSCRQVEKTQGQIVGTKMGFFVGNDQNTLLYDFMQKIGIKYRKICSDFRNLFKWLVMQKTLWMVLNARKLETEAVRCAVETQ